MPEGRIQLGVIGRAHGVRGLVKITSHTADPADLTAYGPLSDAAGLFYALRWKSEGVAEVARIVDGVAVRVSDRSQAEKLTNTKLFINRSALPPADKDEYYLIDLMGLAAVDPSGRAIGTVSVVHDYGAGVSLEIERGAGPALILPFNAACVPSVDIVARQLIVVEPDEIFVATDQDGAHPVDAHLVSSGMDGAMSAGMAQLPDADGAVPPDKAAAAPVDKHVATSSCADAAARSGAAEDQAA